jgi:membrane fusion protein (multidrug efflux system)
MNKKGWIIGGVFTVLVIGIVGLLKFGSDSTMPVVYLKRGLVAETIQERGVFVPIEQQKVFSEIRGQIESIPVQEGGVVGKNQVVIRINKIDVDYQISQAILKWKSEIIEAEKLERQIEKKRELAKQNIIAMEDFRGLESDFAKLQLSIDAHSEEINHLKHKRNLHDVVSHIQGTASHIFVEKGQMIELGTLLMEIKNPKKLKVEVVIREYEAHKIKVGQKVQIKSSVFPERILHGAISGVVPSISQDQDSSGMKVEISIEDDLSPFNIYPGNQVDLEILLSHKNDCLYLPIEAVKKIENTYFVTLERGHRKKEVKVGAQDQNRIEILSGLDLNEGVVDASFH